MSGLHRYENDFLPGAAWGSDLDRRVAQALGPERLEDARHLLPPLDLPTPSSGGAPPGPHPGTEFIVDLVGNAPVPFARVLETLSRERIAALHFPRLWSRITGRRSWIAPFAAPPDARFSDLALCWDLTALLSEGTEAARELGGFAAGAMQLAEVLGRVAVPRESPEDAACRADRLHVLRARFSRSIELRLMPAGRPFPARAVWRAAYALGMTWGDLDLIHWNGPAGRHLFTLSAVGEPGYFLPERAAEGAGVAGIALGFELPRSPAPRDVYDRMAVALAYFRQKLGGRPTTANGGDLDGDRLDDDRNALDEMTAEMARAGVAPGSPDAARIF